MQFPKSLHAEGWHAHMSQLLHSIDDGPSSRHSRRFHALIAVVAVGALAASAGLSAVDDPRPLDVQLSSAMRNAGSTLKDWQAQLSRGLQVSLRAVADGKDTPPAPAEATPAAPTQVAALSPVVSPAIDADDRDQPVQPQPGAAVQP
jgi:hypothetical protein